MSGRLRLLALMVVHRFQRPMLELMPGCLHLVVTIMAHINQAITVTPANLLCGINTKPLQCISTN